MDPAPIPLEAAAHQLRRNAQMFMWDPHKLLPPAGYVAIEHGGQQYRACLSRTALTAKDDARELFMLSISKNHQLPSAEECRPIVAAVLPGAAQLSEEPFSRIFYKIVVPAQTA